MTTVNERLLNGYKKALAEYEQKKLSTNSSCFDFMIETTKVSIRILEEKENSIND